MEFMLAANYGNIGVKVSQDLLSLKCSPLCHMILMMNAQSLLDLLLGEILAHLSSFCVLSYTILLAFVLLLTYDNRS